MICDICKHNNKCKIIKSMPAISCDRFFIMQNYYEEILNSINSNIKTVFIINAEKSKTLNIHVGTITSISDMMYIRVVVKDDIYNFHIFTLPFYQYKTMFFFNKDELDASILQDWAGYNIKYHEPQKNENGELETSKHSTGNMTWKETVNNCLSDLTRIVPDSYRNSVNSYCTATSTNYRTIPNSTNPYVDYHFTSTDELDPLPPFFF